MWESKVSMKQMTNSEENYKNKDKLMHKGELNWPGHLRMPEEGKIIKSTKKER